MDDFFNEKFPNTFKGKAEPYTGPENIQDVGEYVNIAEYAEAAAGLYDTYIEAELNFTNSDGNPVQGVVRKRFRNNDGGLVGVVNCNPVIYTIKYEVQYLDVFVEYMTTKHIV